MRKSIGINFPKGHFYFNFPCFCSSTTYFTRWVAPRGAGEGTRGTEFTNHYVRSITLPNSVIIFSFFFFLIPSFYRRSSISPPVGRGGEPGWGREGIQGRIFFFLLRYWDVTRNYLPNNCVWVCACMSPSNRFPLPLYRLHYSHNRRRYEERAEATRGVGMGKRGGGREV